MLTRQAYAYCKTSAGVWNANVDGSSTPVLYDYVADGDLEVHRIVVRIENGSNIASNEYGSAAALTNGVLVNVLNTHNPTPPVDTRDLLDGVPVKTNGAWSVYCNQMDSETFANSVREFTVRWAFRDAGRDLLLENGDTLRVTIQDDCSGLDVHSFMVQGHYK